MHVFSSCPLIRQRQQKGILSQRPVLSRGKSAYMNCLSLAGTGEEGVQSEGPWLATIGRIKVVEGTGAGNGYNEAEMWHAVIMVGAGSAKIAILTLKVPLALARKQEVVRSFW
jgi:hypothetical protein